MVIVNSRLFGGDGGAVFDESDSRILRIERVTLHFAHYVTKLEVNYLLDNGERLLRAYGELHGEHTAEITLADDERICALGIRSGAYVDSLTFVTYRLFNLVGMKQYGPYGGSGGQAATVLSPHIREFFGRAGGVLDAIGCRGEEPLLVF